MRWRRNRPATNPEWEGVAARSLRDYALLADGHGAALVSREGSIDWACLPRFDSPALFARLLDRDAGHWRIAPAVPAVVERAYLGDTMVLQTRFQTPRGEIAITDAMALGPGEHGHGIGHDSPHVVIRRVEGLVGHVDMELELAVRPEYGLTVPIIDIDAGGFRTRGGPVAYRCWSPVAVEARAGTAHAQFRVHAGDCLHFGLAPESPWGDAAPSHDGEDLAALLRATIGGWHSWSAIHQTYTGPYADLVHHSGRVLRALTYAPTGAIVAAPTTSLPEAPGGDRNWDYRFCWVRDASLTLEALWVAACPHEAGQFFDFLSSAAGGSLRAGSELQILYGIGAERLVPEHELGHLAGFADSRPVRIGNGAWNQTQLDVYGELLSAACLLSQVVGQFDPVTARFLVDVAEVAASRWEEPDQGIWEMRGPPRHFVHSKLMCWVAMDRAIALAPLLDAERHVQRWEQTRDDIRRVIETRGWSDTLGSFAQSFDEHALDASVLALVLTGFLAADDARARATVEAVAGGLTDEHGFVYRYRSDDGLEGEEGTFAICTFWLAQCFALLGDGTRARQLFEQVVAHANDVGLLSEEIDPRTGELLGNFPQAFTHIGLVNAAWAIATNDQTTNVNLQMPGAAPA